MIKVRLRIYQAVHSYTRELYSLCLSNRSPPQPRPPPHFWGRLKKNIFHEHLRFSSFPDLLGLIFQNVFSPKAAGWTQPLAFEKHEIHEFPRFCNFVRPSGPDMGSTKLRNVFPVISVLSILSQLSYGAKKEAGSFFCLFLK